MSERIQRHTPEPWRAEAWGREHDWKVLDARGRMIIATLHEERARLIAAAPDLLEAAHLAFKGIENGWLTNSADTGIVLGRLQRAIAKAEGRE